MNKEMNHAIIGCGRIAQNHYNAANINNIKVDYCCDKDRTKAINFAKKNNIKNYTDNYKEILDNESIDSVSICTDHASHTEIAKDFINKKHIVIEKPLSTRLSNAKKFYQIANKSNKLITIISQHRFDDAVMLAKRIVKNNELGDITLVNAKLKCNRDIEYYTNSYWRGKIKLEGGSTVINQAYHIVDTIVYLFGLPLSVNSYLSNYKFKDVIETEDTCVSILKYNNFLCTFSSTNTSTVDWKTEIEIIGTKGEMVFNIDFPAEILEFNVTTDIEKKYTEEIKKIKNDYEINKNSGVNYYGLSHIRQFKNFKDSFLGIDNIKVSIDDAMNTQTLLESIYNYEK